MRKTVQPAAAAGLAAMAGWAGGWVAAGGAAGWVGWAGDWAAAADKEEAGATTRKTQSRVQPEHCGDSHRR